MSDTEAVQTELSENLQINDDGGTKVNALAGTIPNPDVSYPLKVPYCGECLLPLEYCSYSGKFDQCKAWREKNVELLEAEGVKIVTDEDAVDEKKHQKRGGKGLPKAPKEVKVTNITLQRASRGKNKSMTVVKGLSTHGIDMKQAAKFFASKFACGASVTAVDEIVIQGDVKEDLLDLIPTKWPQVKEEHIEDLGDQKR